MPRSKNSAVPPGFAYPDILFEFLTEVIKNDGDSFWKSLQEREKELAHLGMSGPGTPQFENMSPFPKVTGHDQFRFQTVGKNGTGFFGASPQLNELQVVLLGLFHGIYPGKISA